MTDALFRLDARNWHKADTIAPTRSAFGGEADIAATHGGCQ